MQATKVPFVYLARAHGVITAQRRTEKIVSFCFWHPHKMLAMETLIMNCRGFIPLSRQPNFQLVNGGLGFDYSAGSHGHLRGGGRAGR
jgi:hypothetical protein